MVLISNVIEKMSLHSSRNWVNIEIILAFSQQESDET